MKQAISDQYSIITELFKIKLQKAKSFGSPMNCEYLQYGDMPKSCIVSRLQNNSHPLGI